MVISRDNSKINIDGKHSNTQPGLLKIPGFHQASKKVSKVPSKNAFAVPFSRGSVKNLFNDKNLGKLLKVGMTPRVGSFKNPKFTNGFPQTLPSNF